MDSLNKQIHLEVFTSEIDGHAVVRIDTAKHDVENENGPILRVVLNDDFENPIYDNTKNIHGRNT